MGRFAMGVQVLAICIYTNAAAQDRPGSVDLPLSISIVYFDQSSYQLRPGVKVNLDSIARLLVVQPKLMAAVTGYTDNIGKQELNRVLARDRAQTIGQYLQQHGVPATQILTSWEEPDKKALADGPEAMKTISRRAVIQLYPK